MEPLLCHVCGNELKRYNSFLYNLSKQITKQKSKRWYCSNDDDPNDDDSEHINIYS